MPTIMIRHATDQQIERARELTGQSAASKAFVDCVDRLDRCESRCSILAERVARLESELASAQRVIQGAHDSAEALLAASREYHGILL